MEPWQYRYASTAALETLGQAFKDANELFEHYYEAFYNETKNAADLSAAQEGVEALEKQLLTKRIAAPLSGPLLYTSWQD